MSLEESLAELTLMPVKFAMQMAILSWERQFQQYADDRKRCEVRLAEIERQRAEIEAMRPKLIVLP